ncbi:MAG: type II CRISPR-associated endonuclease Cas1 [Sphaerochaeta sp.]|nr:type II CRISPR-associated endonuclease Cas1 [Sphaerochaeta sp.]
MGFRTVVITKHVKCYYKNDYLVVQGDTQKMVHLSEIDAVIFDTTAMTVTGVILTELVKWKIAVVFCDERHIPSCYLLPLTANFISTKRIFAQMQWDEKRKDYLWGVIVKYKIEKQAFVLQKKHLEAEKQVSSYGMAVQDGDVTNREAFAAKVYFNALFGKDFSRDGDSSLNAMLNYGYSILVSLITKEVVAAGYLPQIGIHHCSEYNPYNLVCDLMEPFRPIVDDVVFENRAQGKLTLLVKEQFWGMLQMQFVYGGALRYLSTILHLYVHECMAFLENGEVKELLMYEKI